jgi:hypothetical protein
MAFLSARILNFVSGSKRFVDEVDTCRVFALSLVFRSHSTIVTCQKDSVIRFFASTKPLEHTVNGKINHPHVSSTD